MAEILILIATFFILKFYFKIAISAIKLVIILAIIAIFLHLI